jgi:hypothetical protein
LFGHGDTVNADQRAAKQIPPDELVDLAGGGGVGAFTDMDGEGLPCLCGVVEFPFPPGLKTYGR